MSHLSYLNGIVGLNTKYTSKALELYDQHEKFTFLV